MKALRKFFTFRNIAITILVLLSLFLLAYFFWEPVAYTFGNRENLEAFIKSLGIWGPLAVIFLQIVQVVIAPIPGQFTSIVSGFLYGWWGLPLTIIGATVGFIIVIALSRRFGRPLLEKFFKPEQIKKFDFIANRRGVSFLFIGFLLPIIPDDLLAYLAGLTKIRFRNLVIIAIIGRLPGYLVLNMLGSSVQDANAKLVVALLVFSLIVFALAYWQKDWLDKFIKSNKKLNFLRKSFKKRKKQIASKK
ncbi:TVP38/TMEM64 family protein [Candidatus Saccharibacteria bacterium]|nr:TVP38/TMEM64 family protein [Candidatus Saccharibacteria bacterium]